MSISLPGGTMEKWATGVMAHENHFGKISAMLARNMGKDDRDIEMLRVAAAMHDGGRAYKGGLQRIIIQRTL